MYSINLELCACLIVSTCLSICPINLLMADENDGLPMRSPRIDKILNSEYSDATGSVFSVIDLSAEEYGLLAPTNLTCSRNLVIAVQSKWASIIQNTAHHNVEETSFETQMAMFIGYLEGKLQVVPPKWFQELLLQGAWYDAEDELRNGLEVLSDARCACAEFSLRDNSLFDQMLEQNDNLYALCYYDQNRSSHMVKEWVTTKRGTENTLLITLNNGDKISLRLKQEVIDPSVVCCHRHKGCYTILILNQFGSRVPIYCLDAKQDKILWTAESWSTRFSHGFEGVLPHAAVSIVDSGNRITVFGTAFKSIYIEQYSASSGFCTFRFSSDYIFVDAGKKPFLEAE